jgi:hypothetical protein
MRYSVAVFIFVFAFFVYAQEESAPINCQVFPEDNIWNTPVDELPVHPLSDDYIATIGEDVGMHPDFGSGFWPEDSESPIGIPYTLVDGSQEMVEINYTDYGDESDEGPMPIPADALIEGGEDGDGDRHVLVVDDENCMLYELYYSFPTSEGWDASSGAVYELNEHLLRPLYWTSADAAGLPIFPGLVRYEEVAAGEINHAIRFTVEETQRAFIWPARHYASDIEDAEYPPMGLRLRLRADFDISGFSADAQVILTAMKTYGIILADNGSSMFFSGSPDPSWDNDTLVPEFRDVTAGDFEAVDVCGLMLDEDSGQINPAGDSDGDCMVVGD